MKRVLWILPFLGAAACSNAPGGAADAGPIGALDTGSGDTGTSVGPVTYYGDVRPILAEHCVGCHTDGGIAPIALDSYEAAMPAAPLIVSYTMSRRMPPFLADNSGACGNFDTNEWLTDRELATLSAWNDQGTPMGDPATPPPMVTPVPHLTGPGVLTFDTGVDYAPNHALTDDYHCFIVNAPRGGYVTGAEVHPGDPRMVHHVIVYEPQTDQAAADVMALDAAEAGPGYTCFGGAGSDATLPIVLWAPGGGAVHAPAGTGLQISATRPLVVQVHYNLLNAAPGATDRSAIDVEIADSAIPGFFLPIADLDFVAPAHMSSTTSHYDMDYGAIWLGMSGVHAAHVYSIGPHMHTLGTDIQVDMLNADGSTDCMVHIPRWDFNWQRGYLYQQPIPITDTTRMRITCTWNTSSRDTDVRWGEGTQDEMCLAFLYVSI
jgi:hypothetical protein